MFLMAAPKWRGLSRELFLQPCAAVTCGEARVPSAALGLQTLRVVSPPSRPVRGCRLRRLRATAACVEHFLRNLFHNQCAILK